MQNMIRSNYNLLYIGSRMHFVLPAVTLSAILHPETTLILLDHLSGEIFSSAGSAGTLMPAFFKRSVSNWVLDIN